MSTLPAAAALLAALVVSGCSADAGQGQATSKEPIASEHQALSGLVFDSWGGIGQYGGACADFTNGAPATLDLKVGAGWQCFVAGVFGNTTQGGVSVFQNPGNSWCYPNYGNDWVLAINALPGAALAASAVCVPATNTGVSTQGAAPQTITTNVNQNTFCGFTDFNGPYTQPFSGDAFVSNDDKVEPTFTGSSSWTWFETNSPYGQQSYATCAVSSTQLVWGGSNWGQSTSYDFSVPAGTGCYLSYVAGTFNDNNFGDGVSVTPVNATTWNFTAAAGKAGAFYCIE